MDKVNFQGRTVLITSPKKYAERLQTISNSKSNIIESINHIRPGYTKRCDINDGDIFVLVHNGCVGVLRRIGYDVQMGAKDFIDSICEDLQNFGNDLKENITCIIMGGRSKDSVTTKCVIDIADGVETFLANNDEKGDLSIICGLTDELTSPIFVDCKRALETPEIYIPANIEGQVSQDKLADVFDIVELNNIDLVG